MSAITLNSSATLPLLHVLDREPALRSFIVIRGIDELCSQMLNVAIGWYVYSATHNPVSLAYVGLARFLPNIGMVLVTGHAADRLDRRKIIGLSLFLQALCIAAFGILSASAALSIWPVYFLLSVIGAAQAFCSPAMSATLPRLVSSEEFPRAVAVVSSAWQICALVGPAVGGLLYALSGPGMFLFSALLYLVALTQVLRLAKNAARLAPRRTNPLTPALSAVSAIFARTAYCSPSSRSTFSPFSWVASPPYSPFSPRTSSRSALRDSAVFVAHPASAPPSLALSWRIALSSVALASGCFAAWQASVSPPSSLRSPETCGFHLSP